MSAHRRVARYLDHDGWVVARGPRRGADFRGIAAMRRRTDLLTTRGAFRVAFALLVTLTLVLGVGRRDASAVLEWCKTDPIVTIGDATVSIFVSATTDILGNATGPTEVVVTVPTGVSYSLVATDNGFGYGETVTFVESDNLRATPKKTQITVDVYVPATGPYAVQVEVVPAIAGVVTSSTTGETNAWLRLGTRV